MTSTTRPVSQAISHLTSEQDDPIDELFVEWSNLPGVTGHELNIDDVQCEKTAFGRSQYEVFKGRFHGAAVRGVGWGVRHRPSVRLWGGVYKGECGSQVDMCAAWDGLPCLLLNDTGGCKEVLHAKTGVQGGPLANAAMA